ncbi:MAG: hypothetical protein J6I76_01510 [Oribacterium sp.]|nr:hypothetical protein [Oribacterium sp.]
MNQLFINNPNSSCLVDILKGDKGPLYLGIITIGSLVLGWKFMDDKYALNNGNLSFEPSSIHCQTTCDNHKDLTDNNTNPSQ